MQITTEKLNELENLLSAISALDAQQKELDRRMSGLREQLADIVTGYIPDDAEAGGEILPGVQVKVEFKPTFDTNAALAYAFDPANLPSAAPILKVKADGMATVIDAVIRLSLNPALIFDLDKPGYTALLKTNTLSGAPVISTSRVRSVALKPAAFKFGDELRSRFEVVEMQPQPEAVNAD